ncbi:uncharacterized protein LOC144150174 isoform X2 [Haemaphysalis longicornis]
MDMRLHTWLVLFLLCVCFTQGLEHDNDDSEEKEQAPAKLDKAVLKEKPQVQKKPDVEKPPEKGTGQKKVKVEHPEATGQKKVKEKQHEEKGQSKVEKRHPEDEGSGENKVDAKNPKEKGPGQKKIKNPEEKGQEQKKLDVKNPEGKGKGQETVDLKTPGAKDEGQSTVDVKQPEEQGKEQEKVDEKIPKRKGKKKKKAKKKTPEKKGQEQLDGENPELQEHGQNKVDVQKPEKKGQSQNKVDVQQPEEKEQGQKELDGEIPGGKEKGQKKVDEKVSEETGRKQSKVDVQKPESQGQGQKEVDVQQPEGKSRKLPPVCYEPKKVGVCRAAITRWYYDGQRCRKFIYGGCGANGNNFETKQACKKKCGGKSRNKVDMQQPEEKGQEQNKVDVQHPEEKGQGQNKVEVQKLEGKEKGQKKVNVKVPEAKEKEKSKVDVQKPESQGQGQKEVDVQQPEEKGGKLPPVCSEPKKVGVCRAAIPRWYYDGHRCRKFIYGGCGANGNNFKTKQACKETCGGKSRNKVDVQQPEPKGQGQNKVDVQHPEEKEQGQNKVDVQQPEKKGQRQKKVEVQQTEGKEQGENKVDVEIPEGKETKPKKAAGKVPEEKGQGQNKVDVQRPEEKAPAPPPRCLEAKKVGPCKASKRRFYFNGRACVEFKWGGCERNGNNFKSKCDCERKCLRRKLPCKCYEPKDPGPCTAAIPRWYFNGKNCKKFVWGGCKGNKNNFETKQQCKVACGGFRTPQAETGNSGGEGQQQNEVQGNIPQVKDNGQKEVDEKIPVEEGPGQNKMDVQQPEGKATEPPKRCFEKKKTGPCRASKRRWYFNGTECKEFIWGGCERNGNNFKTKCACERKCFRRKLPCVCYQPRDVGACRAGIPRWYFSVRYNKCKKFLWGGCKSNGNNFETKKQCNVKCGGLGQSKVETDDTEGKGPTQEKAETGNLGEKEPTPEKGSTGNLAGKGEEEKKPGGGKVEEKYKAPPVKCFAPLKPGPCKASIDRYWFDGQNCRRFLWGGCASNGNNFKTKLLCEKTCVRPPRPQTCIGPIRRGPCARNIKRWWFNGKECREFIYGGCDSNGNNYKTKEECENTCLAPRTNCTDPLKTGPCKGAAARFYFDGRICKRFLWGGCFPNGNNFRTMVQCEKRCIARKRPPLCNQPVKVGPCKASIPRWYFNGDNCVEFLWGGCKPNKNNFRTREICQRRCME